VHYGSSDLLFDNSILRSREVREKEMRFYYLSFEQNISKPFFSIRGLLLSALLLLVTSVLALPTLALGERPDSKLKEGMFPWELVKVFGPPNRSVVMEARREILWTYSWGSVRFHEGRLRSWDSGTARSVRAMDPIEFSDVPRPRSRGVQTKLPVKQGVDPREILSSLSEDEGGSATPSPQSVGGQQLRRGR